MYIKRNIDKYLLEWKNTPIHKPLLLRGARQVGKSSAIRELGRSFKYYIEVNFESREDLKEIFEQLSDVHEIANRLGMRSPSLTKLPASARATSPTRR